jgi:hypothetical protein
MRQLTRSAVFVICLIALAVVGIAGCSTSDNSNSDGGMMGNGGGGTEAQTRVHSSGGDNPLKKLLEEMILPEKKTTEALAGLLYFPLGKQKAKDLELVYKAPDGKIAVRFK